MKKGKREKEASPAGEALQEVPGKKNDQKNTQNSSPPQSRRVRKGKGGEKRKHVKLTSESLRGGGGRAEGKRRKDSGDGLRAEKDRRKKYSGGKRGGEKVAARSA